MTDQSKTTRSTPKAAAHQQKLDRVQAVCSVIVAASTLTALVLLYFGVIHL